MTTRAAQIECLLTPVIDHRTNSVASAYTAYFYSAGTSNPKNVWTEKEKTNPYTSRELGSDGTVQVYGDGVYRIIIKDADSTTVHDWDDVKVQANTFTVQTKSDTYTATADDDLILAGGTFTVNISAVAGFTHPLIVKRISGTITVAPYSAETIDGSSTITLTASDDSAVLYPDASAGIWRRAYRLPGLTSTVTELNLLDGITAILDEDDMASDSDTSLSTQQSIKAYVDSEKADILDGTDPITALDVNGNGDVSGDLSANTLTTTDLDLNGNADISGVATVTTLNVSGDLSADTVTTTDLDLNGNADISGVATVTTLDLSGNCDVGGTLDISGVATGTTLNLSGNGDVGGTLDIGSGTTRRVAPAETFDPDVNTTLYDVDANLTNGSWESLGPTGSSADHVWPTLNDVPTDADWVTLQIQMRCDTGPVSTMLEADVSGRKNSGSHSYHLARVGDVGTISIGVCSVERRVLLGTGVTFQLKYESNFTNDNITIEMQGWGFNP